MIMDEWMYGWIIILFYYQYQERRGSRMHYGLEA